HHHADPPFPTRRSSDLPQQAQAPGGCAATHVLVHTGPPEWARAGFNYGAGDWALPWALSDSGNVVAHLFARQLVASGERPDGSRSEEHTSELQSLRHLV